MKRTPEQTEATRRSLMKAALDVFLEKGYSDTRIEDIAGRAGVTRGAFYHHFESKPAIYYAVLQDGYTPALPIASRTFSDPSVPAIQALREVFGEYLRLIGSNPDFRRTHELVILKSAFVPELDQGRGEKIRSLRQTIDWIAGVVARGQAAGELRPDMDPRDAAQLFFGALSGLVTAELMDPGSTHLDERWRHYVDIVMRMLTARET